MKILDMNNQEINAPDMDKGYTVPDKLFVKHHPAVEAVEEAYHYEYTEYPNGGKDRHKIIDVPGVEASEAWDEYEDILRYIEYTAEELEARQKAADEAYRNSPEYKIVQLEETLERVRQDMQMILKVFGLKDHT